MKSDKTQDDAEFQFVSADEARTREARRRARSHAVKHALQLKRQKQREAQQNFCVVSAEQITRKSRPISQKRAAKDPTLEYVPSPGILDPFEVLPIDSRRFQSLLNHGTVRQALEPVFSVASYSAFHDFRTVFRRGLDDPALGNAVMLTLTFAYSGDNFNSECLKYQSQAFGQLRRRMVSIDATNLLATIGAILFLAGVEARLGVRAQTQIHLGAIEHLLGLALNGEICLTPGMKRAIFWQDLNASIMTGTSRIVDHNTFAELRWERDPLCAANYRLPPGLADLSDLLSPDFVAILEDIHALEAFRDQWEIDKIPRPCELIYANNEQASIQSRLVALTGLPPMLECVRLAAYLCTSMLCCRVWCGPVVPRSISNLLLRHLEQGLSDPSWDGHAELLRWIICVGASFTPHNETRSGFEALVRERLRQRFSVAYCEEFFRPLPSLDAALARFIWCEKPFSPHATRFWNCVAT